MVAHVPEIQKHWQDKRISVHLCSLEALMFFLAKHEEREVCLNSIVSPTQSLRGDSVRHYAVCASACLYGKPGTPIAYATFLAASGAWSGPQHARVLYPLLASDDPLRTLPVQKAIARLQKELFLTIERTLEGGHEFSLVKDAQWDVPDAWAGLAKGFAWQGGEWNLQPSDPSSPFVVS